MKKLATLGIILLLSGIVLRTVDINVWQRTYAPALAAKQVKPSNEVVTQLRMYNLFSQTVIPSIMAAGILCLVIPTLINRKKA